MTACMQIVSVLVAFALNKTQQELIRGYSDDDEEVGLATMLQYIRQQGVYLRNLACIEGVPMLRNLTSPGTLLTCTVPLPIRTHNLMAWFCSLFVVL